MSDVVWNFRKFTHRRYSKWKQFFDGKVHLPRVQRANTKKGPNEFRRGQGRARLVRRGCVWRTEGAKKKRSIDGVGDVFVLWRLWGSLPLTRVFIMRCSFLQFAGSAKSYSILLYDCALPLSFASAEDDDDETNERCEKGGKTFEINRRTHIHQSIG